MSEYDVLTKKQLITMCEGLEGNYLTQKRKAIEWGKENKTLKEALLILGRIAKGCPKIKKADSCNEWTTGRACPKCRADDAITQATPEGG